MQPTLYFLFLNNLTFLFLDCNLFKLITKKVSQTHVDERSDLKTVCIAESL